MKHISFPFRNLLWLLTAAVLTLGITTPEEDTSGYQSLNWMEPLPVNAFSFDVLHQLAQDGDTPPNLIASPQSLFHGLAMSYLASGGDTREELKNALHFPERNPALLKQLADQRSHIRAANRIRGVQLHMANGLWIDDTYANFRKEYTREVKQGLQGSLHRIAFADTERAAGKINQWIRRQTQGNIRDSFSPERLVPSRSNEKPALVSVNAIFFDAEWGSRFDEDATRSRPFSLDSENQTETPMMHQNALLTYSENETLQFLKIPYKGDQVSMWIVLPKTVTPVKKLATEFTPEMLMELWMMSSPSQVDVLFPKFDIRNHVDAKQILNGLGVQAAFDPEKADFQSMIHPTPDAVNLYLSDITQDAMISVSEKGTKAAAVSTHSGFSIACSAPAKPRPVTFHADHPFLYFIVHDPSQTILFTGWMSEPEGGSPE